MKEEYPGIQNAENYGHEHSMKGRKFSKKKAKRGGKRKGRRRGGR